MTIGLIGAGSVAESVLDAVSQIPEMKIKAIGATANGLEKMQRLAWRFSIDRIYCECDQMVEDDDLTCIYVATPNHLHYQYTKMALMAGKHVICEKPFCSNTDQLVELIEFAREKQLFLFEAISNQYYPNYQKVQELMPELGTIKLVELNYSQLSKRYSPFKNGEYATVFDHTKSGGALMDLNVYNIHFVVGLFGKPDRVRYYANVFHGVDTSGTLVLEYPEFVCVASAAKDCAGPCRIAIQGEEGYIYSDEPSNLFRSFSLKRNLQESECFALNGDYPITQRFIHEYRAFVDMVRRNDTNQNMKRLEHSLCVQQILDEARICAGIQIMGGA